MGFERNYQVKILSKQLNKSFYSTIPEINLLPIKASDAKNDIELNPYFYQDFMTLRLLSVLQFIKIIN
jgi:hypothetical protein